MSYSRHWTTHVSSSLKSRTLNNKRSLSFMRCHADQHRCHANQYCRTISPLARRVAAFPHNGNAKGTRPYTMNVAELFHGLSKQESHKPTYQRVRRVSLELKPLWLVQFTGFARQRFFLDPTLQMLKAKA